MVRDEIRQSSSSPTGVKGKPILVSKQKVVHNLNIYYADKDVTPKRLNPEIFTGGRERQLSVYEIGLDKVDRADGSIPLNHSFNVFKSQSTVRFKQELEQHVARSSTQYTRSISTGSNYFDIFIVDDFEDQASTVSSQRARLSEDESAPDMKKIPTHISLVLRETNTFFLLDLPSYTSIKDTEEGDQVEGENEQYDYLTEGKGRNRKVLNAEVQTIQKVMKTRMTLSEKSKTQTGTSFVSNWDMYDTYQSVLEASSEESEKSDESNIEHHKLDEIGSVDSYKMSVDEKQMMKLMKNPRFLEAICIVERLLANNCYNEQQKIYRGLSSPDNSREKIEYNYKLKLLWTFANESTKGLSVNAINWNPANKDIVAIGYGKFYFPDKFPGLVLIWNIKNPVQPERRYTFKVSVMSLRFSESSPVLLGVGFEDGSVKVLNVSSREKVIIGENEGTLEPVWCITWNAGHNEKSGEELVGATFDDGRICTYVLQTKLERIQLMRVAKADGKLKGYEGMKKCQIFPVPISRYAAALFYVAHPTDKSLYLVGTNEGTIHKCSLNYLNQHLDMFLAHDGPVHNLKYSPFCKKIFATCGDDWHTRIWGEGISEPILEFFQTMQSIQGMDWSPTHSTILVTIRGQMIEIWDIQRKVYGPQSITSSPTGSRNTVVQFTDNGSCLIVGDVDGNVHVFSLEDMPFPAFFQENLMFESMYRALITNPNLTEKATVVRNAPQQDLMNELKFFVKGAATRKEKPNALDLTKSALTLLKSLPASRIAVFEYFCRVFDSASLNYIQAVEAEIKTGSLPPLPELDELVVSEIHSVLATLISDNPVAWAPTISTWTLELLGEISSRYSGRAHFSTNLNETLQLWMACRATRTLVDINTKCLSSLIHSDTEACISALLDTSVKHSPHFDWVVAHVGSCFPNTVITRVLSCGLKDFCQNKSYDQGCNSPKLKSVVGILGHLAGSHVEDIRKAILDMFTWSLRETFEDNDLIRLQKKATVPYILQLVYLSSTLLSSICTDTKHILTVEVVTRLYYFVEYWCRYFGTPEALEELVTTLILRCEIGGEQIIKLLLDCIHMMKIRGNEQMKSDIVEKSKGILTNVLQEMNESVRHGLPVSLISSFSKETQELEKMLLSPEKIVYETAGQIIVLLGHLNPATLVKAAQYLLQNATNHNQLVLLLNCLTNDLIDKTASPYSEKGGHFSVVLEQILSRHVQKFFTSNEEDLDLSQMWNNLLTLLQWEKSGRVPFLNSRIITRTIEANLTNLTSLFTSENLHMHIIADILDTMEIPTPNESYSPPIQVILNMTQSTVNYFFACCHDDGTSSRVKGFKKVNQMLKRLCTYSMVAKVLALRELLERALFRKDNILFGAVNNEHDHESDKHLLKQNKKINKTIPLTKHSSVFNGGIIGTGKRKSTCHNELPSDAVSDNTRHLINAMKACCTLPEENKYSDMSWDSMTLLSLLLVQFVSPDVMYNGLPWPEEEFSKVTMERDLFIRRMFTNTPLLWELLSFVGVYRPAICYCSVLIRALTATLIHQWKSMGEQSKDDISDNYKSLMDTTVKVIDIMALGQLLPPPLSNIRDVLPYLKCYEIVAILRECVWCYMRDHIPSPALFVCDSNGVHWRDPITARPSEIYTNTLRIIMQRNIRVLGHMYAQMFINVPTHDS
ncbi:hypothetical protein JTB14_031106 [Gonioctena quinquepunctata]|nr:hypothetical protein JTB14_031106 [Gonioctena quinquepunctata]